MTAGYDSVLAHRAMALDEHRNRAYEAALARWVGPETVVLDAGAGLGILGLLAARLGARRVYLVEPEDVLAVASEIVRANRWEERVRCLQGRVEEIELPEKVDLVVSALTGNLALGEDLLPTLFAARDRFLGPGGRMVPDLAVVEAAPVSAPDLWESEVGVWSRPSLGIDLTPARAYAANSLVPGRRALRRAELLAEPRALAEIDLRTARVAALKARRRFTITGEGPCHGCCAWFRMRLAGEWLSTAPRQPATHWSPFLLPVDPPLRVAPGDRVELAVDRPQDGGWSWRVRAGEQKRAHSALFATPLTAAARRRQAKDYRPRLSARGRALKRVLEACDGETPAETIAAELRAGFPELFADPARALLFVQQALRRLADDGPAAGGAPG